MRAYFEHCQEMLKIKPRWWGKTHWDVALGEAG